MAGLNVSCGWQSGSNGLPQPKPKCCGGLTPKHKAEILNKVFPACVAFVEKPFTPHLDDAEAPPGTRQAARRGGRPEKRGCGGEVFHFNYVREDCPIRLRASPTESSQVNAGRGKGGQRGYESVLGTFCKSNNDGLLPKLGRLSLVTLHDTNGSP
jgi:hypothetical protein